MTEQTHRITAYKTDAATPTAGETPTVPDTQPRLLIVSAWPDRHHTPLDLFESVLNCSFSVHQPGISLNQDSAVLRQAANFIRRLAHSMSECDVVHIIESSRVPFLLFTLPAILLSRFYGKRTILETCAVRTERNLEKWRLLLLPILRQANSIVVASNSAAQNLIRFDLHPHVIPPHIDCQSIPHREISSLQPQLLCTRPMESDMNLPCLLRAFKLVKQKYPRAELVLSGDGPLRHNILRIIDGEHIGGVTVSDPSPTTTLDELLATCDLMVNSSSRDDLPVTLLHAMAAGIPVVTTDAGGIPELAQHTDALVLVPLNDHSRLAEQVIRLIEKPDLVRRLSTSGRLAAQQYSASRVYRAWAAVYGLAP